MHYSTHFDTESIGNIVVTAWTLCTLTSCILMLLLSVAFADVFILQRAKVQRAKVHRVDVFTQRAQVQNRA